MSAANEQIYQRHLNQVSRSFSFCIAQLRSPLRAWVGLTYLICRILDTIEDSKWNSSAEQIRQLQVFDQFICRRPNQDEVYEWRKSFPKDLPKGESELLDDCQLIFSDYHDIPQMVRGVLLQLVLSMSSGMRHFCERRSQTGDFRLQSLTEVNQYCLFVAGVVGEGLAKMLNIVEPRFRLMSGILKDAHHFGLFLQKVNLLKDQWRDESEGRFLIPNRERVALSLIDNALGAKRFIEALPLDQREFRRFCAWSLFLGLQSLVAISRGQEKLSRAETESLLNEVSSIIDSPTELAKKFDACAWDLAHQSADLKLQAGSVSPSQVPVTPAWLLNSYQGSLNQTEILELLEGA